jgi:hypothetical protein
VFLCLEAFDEVLGERDGERSRRQRIMDYEPREVMKTCHSSNSVSIIRITILGCYAYLSIGAAGHSEENFSMDYASEWDSCYIQRYPGSSADNKIEELY